jgi:hypothetical protein
MGPIVLAFGAACEDSGPHPLRAFSIRISLTKEALEFGLVGDSSGGQFERGFR